ncbi:MAG TPA: lipoyl(octanoyl) transferase LipB [Actinomycetota bacterium]|nr:lipoyl(octanoyl) transferase LipB [Actinomycetota bacterium]
MRPLEVLEAGRVPFTVAAEWQKELHQQRVKDEIRDLLLFLEHPHVYTLGRRFEPAHLRASRQQLSDQGIDLCEVDRGGSITYHGPGQLVCYPILDLSEPGREFPDVVAYVRSLEVSIIKALAELDIVAATVEGRTGVWVTGAKIAAIGVNVSRGVSKHGLAINVCPDLKFFDGMIPCGIDDASVTSVAQELGRDVLVNEMVGPLIRSVASIFGRDLVTEPPSRLPPSISAPSLSST